MIYDINQLPENIRNYIKIIDGCWYWQGAIANETRKHKQPVTRFNGKKMYVSRVIMYIFENFDLDSKLQINHKVCAFQSLCVSPNCMYIGTQQQNIDDIIRIPKVLCNFGHKMKISPTTGTKYCQICKNKKRNEWRKRIKS